jgi:hypothetical protein
LLGFDALPVMLSIKSDPDFHGSIVGLSHDPLDPPNYAPDVVDRGRSRGNGHFPFRGLLP